MKILFMGTPDIAANALQGLLTAGHSICGVFTREDKPVGRKQVLTPPPVKQLALQNNIPVFQPKTLKDGEAFKTISELAPEIIVVVAYGRILPKEILDIPQRGCVNLHVSILPKYRGAAPIQWAVLNGDKKTGVTIMFMDEGLDTGDIITTKLVDIDENETSGELFEKVTKVGTKTLCDTLSDIENGTFVRTKQDETAVSFAPPLTKEMAKLNFGETAEHLHNLVRGFNPWPMAYFEFQDNKVKVTKSQVVMQSGEVGTVLSLTPLVVACGENALSLCEVVPSGKGAMSGSAWALGRHFVIGEKIV